MDGPVFPVGTHVRAPVIADWAELRALSHRAFLRGDLKSAIQREDVELQDAVEEQTWHELAVRNRLFGARWPLRMAGARLVARSRSPLPINLYRYLCLLSMGLAEREDRRLFEEIVAHLVTPLTGNPGLRVGHPASDGMPASFRERVRLYTETFGVSPAEIKAPPLRDDKDLGLDVVTCSPFSDGRGGDVHFLVQCATGRDWKQKLADLSIDEWSDHLNWGVRPVRVFAAPVVIEHADAAWIRLTRRGGLLLDRPRLTELALLVELPKALLASVAARVRDLSAI